MAEIIWTQSGRVEVSTAISMGEQIGAGYIRTKIIVSIDASNRSK